MGHCGSLQKGLKLLKSSQKLKADSILLVWNGTQLHSAVDKLERWWKHFVQVSNVAVEVDERVLRSVLETDLVSPPPAATNDHLFSVTCESEIRTALKKMKNGRAPLADDISAELFKLGRVVP